MCPLLFSPQVPNKIESMGVWHCLHVTTFLSVVQSLAFVWYCVILEHLTDVTCTKFRYFQTSAISVHRWLGQLCLHKRWLMSMWRQLVPPLLCTLRQMEFQVSEVFDIAVLYYDAWRVVITSGKNFVRHASSHLYNSTMSFCVCNCYWLTFWLR